MILGPDLGHFILQNESSEMQELEYQISKLNIWQLIGKQRLEACKNGLK